jgi:hypothetical protein
MLHRLVGAGVRLLSAEPCFRVYGKAVCERDWHEIAVLATHRRDATARWPLWRGTLITWTASVIAVGWDFAEELLREQAAEPASREFPVVVAGGRLRDLDRRTAAGAAPWGSASEVLAHECGHTAQARRWGVFYWPVGGALTLFREGPHWYNRFENQASAEGMFGGIVPGSVCPRLIRILNKNQ